MSDPDTILLPKPPGKLRAALDNPELERVRKIAVTIVILWQLLGGGIEASFKAAMRDVVRSEMAPLQAAVAKLETRLAALEKDLQ